MHPFKPPPPPRRVSARVVIAAGTALFAVAAIVCAALWSWLAEHDHRDWLWTCLTGTVLGLLGLVLVERHRRAGRAVG